MGRWDAHGDFVNWNSTEIFTGCADITISLQSTTPSPVPTPAPVPTPPSTGGQCCYTAGCSSCNGAGEWCSSSASACEGSCGGTYCSQRSSPGRNASLRAVTQHLHSSV